MAVGQVVAAAEVRARFAGATATVGEGGGCAGDLGGWQMPRRSKLHGRRPPRWSWWNAWRVVLSGWSLPLRGGMHRRSCHGGGGGPLGGWPGRAAAAAEVQAAQATATSVEFVGGWEGGGCRGGAGCTGSAANEVAGGRWAGGLGRWQLPRWCKLHVQRLPQSFLWAAGRVRAAMGVSVRGW